MTITFNILITTMAPSYDDNDFQLNYKIMITFTVDFHCRLSVVDWNDG